MQRCPVPTAQAETTAQPLVTEANETSASSKPCAVSGRPVVATARTRLPSLKLTTRLAPSGRAIQSAASTIAEGTRLAGAAARPPVSEAAACQVPPPLSDITKASAARAPRPKVTGMTACFVSLNVGRAESGFVERNRAGAGTLADRHVRPP